MAKLLTNETNRIYVITTQNPEGELLIGDEVTEWLKQHNKSIMNELLEDLEGMKRDQTNRTKHGTECGGCGGSYPAICGCKQVNETIISAQNIIKEKLNN